MYDRLFYTSLEDMNTIQFEIASVKKNNDVSFRRISKEIFSKSFSKIEFHDTFEVGSKILGVGIASVIKKYKGTYKKGSFAKSFNKTISCDNHVTSSDLGRILKFLNTAEFDDVLKLLKHHSQFGFKSCLNMLR